MLRNFKKVLMAVVLVLVLAGTFALVGAAKHSSAASSRDCDTNSIDYKSLNGGCGAMSGSELIADIKSNQPSDLKTVYDHFGLTSDKYDRFASTVKSGTVYKDGRVVVGGQTVMTSANSYGREKFNGQRQPITIGGKTYYHSATQYSFASGVDSLPVMVMFDDKGAPEVVIMNDCGNPVTGTPVKPTYSCKTLSMKSIGNDTYSFSSSFTVTGGAKIEKVTYDFGDGTTATKNSPSDVVNHKFTKSATIKVSAQILLPGGKRITVTADGCAKKVTVTPLSYKCVVLTPRAMNTDETKFRFTVKTTQSQGVTVKSADFSLDGQTSNRGVTTKDSEGNIYQEYTFSDTKKHAVAATVNFNVAGGVKSVTCQASVTAKEKPMCPVEGKGNLPPDSHECKEETPETPAETPTELPNTGVGGTVAGIFAATTVGGAIAHRLVWSRRFSR
jgi:hypothetical protein